MRTQHLIVFTNPVDGREDDYNDWYDNQHIGDVLKIPGVLSAQRFALGDLQRMPAPHPWKYMAIYEVDADTIEETVAGLNMAPGTTAMPMTDALSPDRANWFFVARSERVERSD